MGRPTCGQALVALLEDYGIDTAFGIPGVHTIELYRGLDQRSLTAWHDYLYARSNPAGRHREFWHHERGCRRWLIVERDTCSHAVSSVQFADEANR